MKTLEIHVPDEIADKAEHADVENGVTFDELVRASLEEKLTRDAEFQKAAEYVLEKNSGRYSSEDIHRAVFTSAPQPRSLEELKLGIAEHVRTKHARG
jgi:hypothetical protein